MNFFLPFVAVGVSIFLTTEFIGSSTKHGMCNFSSDVATHDGEESCYFSESYWEARAKFRLLGKMAGAELSSEMVVDGDYTIDFAVFRGSGPGLVVHSSGVHGVEGYAGSAVQCAQLHKIARENLYQTKVLEGPSLVLIHAVNPYGMAHFRRFNEHNVDLNRNAIPPGPKWDKLLSRDPNVANYEDFTQLFNPPRAPTIYDAYIGYFIKAAYNILRFGFVPLKRAIVTGQYHNPKGVFFGGQGQEPSHKIVWDKLEEFADVKGPVTWVDVHTGLGPSGIDTLITKSEEDGENAQKWFADAPTIDVLEAKTAGDVAAGYDLTEGFMNHLYVDRFPNNAEQGHHAFIITQEFGTVPGFFVARAMILENQAFHHDTHHQPFWVRNHCLDHNYFDHLFSIPFTVFV